MNINCYYVMKDTFQRISSINFTSKFDCYTVTPTKLI